jgi:C4-dicarboxylate-specific signal transduction histidine kinase
MLQLTLDTSPAAAREVMDQLNGLTTQSFPPSAGDSVKALLAHGRLLHDLLPTTDGVLRALLASPSGQELKALRAMVLLRQAASRATAREFRLLLYAASLLLLGLLVHLGMQLRARALTLQRRAAFEHVIAGISTRLIDAQPHEIDAHIDRALAELAKLVNADRVYLAVSGNLARIHTWCREGIAFPPGWPDRVPSLVARFDATAEGIIHIQSVDRLPRGVDKDALAAAGLRGWACVSRLSKCGGHTTVLGFDALQAGIITQGAEVGLLRTALDAIANAVVRERAEAEARESERRYREIQTEFAHANRVATIGQLTASIAHEVNQPIAAAVTNAHAALRWLRAQRPDLEEVSSIALRPTKRPR